jgi:hypothetical protein
MSNVGRCNTGDIQGEIRVHSKPKGGKEMSYSARTVFGFGIYLVILGITLIVVPNLLLGTFGLPATNEVWIRIVGMLVLILAFYYTQAARKELTNFLKWTVYARASVFVFFLGFVALGLAQPTLILFGVVDLLGAIWTGLALRSSRTS